MSSTVSMARIGRAAAFVILAASLPAAARQGASPAPGDDFYGFANGVWEAGAVIPPGAGSLNERVQLRTANLENMLALHRRAAQGGPGISAADWKVGTYTAAQLDLAAIEARGMAPARPMLSAIAAIASRRDLARYLGASLRADTDPVNFSAFEAENVFGLWIGPDLAGSGRSMAYLLQGGVGLPSAQSYLSAEPQDQHLRAQYADYIGALLAEAGFPDSTAKAARIVALEARIAATHADAAESADLAKASARWRRGGFKAHAPGLDWDAFFDAAGLRAAHAVGAWQPKAIRGIAALAASEPLAVWRDYLAFHALNVNARFLPKAVSDRYFAFYDPIFIGPGQHRPYWDHVVTQTNTDMPGAGRLFARRYLTAAGKARMKTMLGHIVTAFDAKLARLAWMSPAARAQARAKLRRMTISAGAPERWPDTSALDIRPGDAFGNVQRTQLFNYRRQLAKIGRPVERGEWIPGGELFGINPMPAQNALTIPVTEMQPPYFDPQASDADNYGRIGVRIARFIGQAFGPEGSRFDAGGKARAWWSGADTAGYERAAGPLAAQFSAYQPLPGLALDGKRTLAANAADLVALQVAYDAFRLARAGQDADARAADREFFLAYAAGLRVKSSDKALRGQAAGSPVAPARYRVATVRNLDPWYQAFDVGPGHQLYLPPQERVRLW